MAKKSFMPGSDNKKAFWLSNLAAKIDTYAAKYGISADEAKFLKDASAFFLFWLDYLNKLSEYTKKVTDYKNAIRNGVPAGAVAPVQPVPPDLGAVPSAVDPDIFGVAGSIGLRIKIHKNYTTADGADMGLEGAEDELPDLTTVKPVIKVQPGNMGHPDIIWKKSLMDALDIYVDRGNGDWLFLATDTIPDYTDTAALPAAGQSALWKYKCIYRFNDEPAGQWSDVASITVGGM